MGKKLTKNLGGRPTIYSEELVTKLEGILKIGGTVEEACSYAMINKVTYYRWLDDNESFATRMESAQRYADIVAKNIVVDSMIKQKDLSTAKWWLEKRQFKDSNQTNVQVNNFIPLLDVNTDVRENDSDQQDKPIIQQD